MRTYIVGSADGPDSRRLANQARFLEARLRDSGAAETTLGLLSGSDAGAAFHKLVPGHDLVHFFFDANLAAAISRAAEDSNLPIVTTVSRHALEAAPRDSDALLSLARRGQVVA